MMRSIHKGYAVSFEMEDGSIIAAPRGAGMFHDPSGKQWGKCSALFISFRPRVRRATPEEMQGAPKEYLGREHKGWIGVIPELPPRALAEGWEKIGRVSEILYTRGGTKAPGRYYHPHGKRSLQTFFRKGKLPWLYKRGRAMRMELGSGCVWDDRGIVYP